MRIMGRASAPRDVVAERLASASALFQTEMFPALWDAAEAYGIDPVGMVAQSFKETGGGTFGRATTPGHYNTAGIKRRDTQGRADDDPEAHYTFVSWEVGAIAHAQHLRAYAGIPVHDLILDPRYVWVIGRHQVEEFEGLSGKWAPADNYGTTLVDIARRLAGA